MSKQARSTDKSTAVSRSKVKEGNILIKELQMAETHRLILEEHAIDARADESGRCRKRGNATDGFNKPESEESRDGVRDNKYISTHG